MDTAERTQFKTEWGAAIDADMQLKIIRDLAALAKAGRPMTESERLAFKIGFSKGAFYGINLGNRIDVAFRKSKR